VVELLQPFSVFQMICNEMDASRPQEKRRRISSSDNNNEVQQSKMELFPDEVMTHIISFCHSNEPTEIDVARIFRRFGLVSKFWKHGCVRFVQQTPMRLTTEYANVEDLPMIMWMCRHHVKIKDMITRFLETDLHVSCLVYVLKYCDISSLEVINISWGDKISRAFDWDKSAALEAGIPDEIVKAADGMNMEECQSLIVSSIGDRARSLHVLELICPFEGFHLSLVTTFANQLDDLVLNISNEGGKCNSHTSSQKYEMIGQTIERMPILRRLYIAAQSDFPIRSRSLEELECGFSFQLKECICPSLKKLHISTNMGTLSPSFLSKFSHRLEKLTLVNVAVEAETANNSDSYSAAVVNNSQRFSRIIASMSQLKKLRILQGDYALRINSKSLEQIDSSYCFNGFRIIECICPALKLLKCGCGSFYGPRRQDWLSHVQPIEPFQNGDIGTYGSAKKFKAGDRAFIGMQVADTCEVRLVNRLWQENVR